MINKFLVTLAIVGTTGCATIQIPAESLEHSEANIRGAEEVGAPNVPAAKLHLQLAKDQNEAAKTLAADGDDRALLMLARADADAELALVLAREATVRAEAKQAAADLAAVRARGTTP